MTLEWLFLKNYTQNGVEKLSPSPTLFYKTKIERISGSTVWKLIPFVSIIYPSWGLIKKAKVRSTCFYLIYCLFKTQKEIRNYLCPAALSAWFLEKIISLVIFHYLTNSIVWLLLLCKIFAILGNMCIVIVW